MKVAVFGAGGFVGSTLCERLYFEKEFEFVPIIHSISGAGRLARLPLEFRVASVLDEDKLKQSLEGCDTVINCSRGDGVVMINGMKALIDAARGAGVQRLVHISSIAIYGANPPAEASSETTPPCPDDPYGDWKAQQDEMLFDLHKSGIGIVTLAPGNIYGPYSPFISGAAEYAKTSPLFLVDDGRHPTNNVHVNNIAEAALAALRTDKGWGERYFINEVERGTWREFYDEMCDVLGVTPNYVSVEREAVLNALADAAPKQEHVGIVGHAKILASGDFRKNLGVLPVFAAINGWTYRQMSRLNPRTQQWLRSKVDRPTHIAKQRAGVRLDGKFIREQIRTVYHSPEKAIKQLGFRPFSQRQGMKTVADWLRFTTGQTKM